MRDSRPCLNILQVSPENRKVYRSGTTSSTMGHEGRRSAYMDAMESKVRKLWRKGVGMPEIWKAMRAILVGFPCIHLRSRTRQNVHDFRRFGKSY